jgi:hypothetical protein
MQSRLPCGLCFRFRFLIAIPALAALLDAGIGGSAALRGSR